MSDSIRKQCRFITENHNQIFLRKRNVVGMGYGYKISNGFNTGELCFKIFVAKKESTSSLNESDFIPNIYQGMKTDIVQTGQFKQGSLSEKDLPLKFGSSIGPNDTKITGTAGCLVIDERGDYHILSSSHILSKYGKVPIGTPILHPSLPDGGEYPQDIIAHLSKIIPLKIVTKLEDLHDYKKEDYNYVDCAIAKINNTCLVTKQIAFIGKVKGVCDPKLNMRVKKTGRTSEFTTGIVTDLDAFLALNVEEGKVSLFDNQIVTTFIGNHGDSGSLVLDECNNAIGLLFGIGQSSTIINPIKEVLKALNVKIVTC